MDVKKIFITLISVVACLFIGAFVLNTILPNVTATGINAIESAVQNGTGVKVDVNGDGKVGNPGGANSGDAKVKDNSGITNGGNVGGAQGFGISNKANKTEGK